VTLIQVAAPARQRRCVTFERDAEHVEWTAAAYRQGWLSSRHSLPVELALVVGVYVVYEATRGLVAGDANIALRHAQDVVSLERSLHIFVERSVQHAALAVPGLMAALGFAYLTLHLVVTAGLLLWLYRRRPAAYPFVRTTLVLASALAMVGCVVFPTAPPRLTDVGIVDTGLEQTCRPQQRTNQLALQPVRRCAEHARWLRADRRCEPRSLRTPPDCARRRACSSAVRVASDRRDRKPLLRRRSSWRRCRRPGAPCRMPARHAAVCARSLPVVTPGAVGDLDIQRRPHARDIAEGRRMMVGTEQDATIRPARVHASPDEAARWILVLSVPVAVASAFFMASVGTGVAWLIAPMTVATPAGAIPFIVLALTSDTNVPAAVSTFEASTDVSAAREAA
jgi:PAP2 superfamily